MPEIIHFRGSDKIFKKNHIGEDIHHTLQYLEDVLYGTGFKGELFRMALKEMGWRDNDEILRIIDGRRYTYKGFKKGIAIDGNFSAYEFILEGLLRLQLGYDKKTIDAGLLILNGRRSDKSSLGTSKDLAISEVEVLFPTINLPVAIALFDLGLPRVFSEEDEIGDTYHGIPIPKLEDWPDKDTAPPLVPSEKEPSGQGQEPEKEENTQDPRPSPL